MIDIQKGTSYARVPNECLRDNRISLKAKAMYAFICGCKEDWRYSVKGFKARIKESTGTINRACQELEAFGYLKRTQIRDSNGRVTGYSYEVFDYPIVESPVSENSDVENEHNKLELPLARIKESRLIQTNPFSLSDDRGAFEKYFGRRLRPSEVPIWEKWVNKEINPAILKEAIRDNEYRGEKINLQHVDETLRVWTEVVGLDSYKGVLNYRLNQQLENTERMLKEKYYSELYKFDEIFESTEVYRLVQEIGDIKKLFYTSGDGRRAVALPELNEALTYLNPDVLIYLPDKILRYGAKYFESIGDIEKQEAFISAMEGGVDDE